MTLARFTSLDDELAVGSHPHAPEHVTFLARQQGVQAVVSLQTDEDLAARGLRWSMLWQLYLRLGVHATRVPVTDFDPADLLRHLDDAVAAVAACLEAGRRTYVHCTAGLNRSPTTLMAYLVAHRGLSVDAAEAWVASRHECIPYRDVLDTWARRHGYALHDSDDPQS